MNITIMTRVYNNLEITKSCIESIKKHTADMEYEHIVIDNNSTDGTLEYLKSLPWIKLISNEQNNGCAKALNQGVKAATGEYIVNVDNDVTVGPNWLKPMVDLADKYSDVGIVSPGTREGLLDFDIESYGKEYTQRMKNITADECGGWCMLIKREVFDKVGLFDEELFNMYCEDSDFFMRMREAGYRPIRTGASFIHHKSNVTLSKMPGKVEFEKKRIAILRKKWNLTQDPYFVRKGKTLRKFVKHTYWKLFHGHILIEKI